MAQNEIVEDDIGIRDARGEWRPDRLPEPPPLFIWPPRLGAFVKWLFGNPGYFWPWNLFYVALAVVTYFFLTPDITQMKSLEVGWIAAIYLRNLALLVVFASIFQIRLYKQKAQGKKYKYNARWLGTKSNSFLFGDQLWDNVFWSIVSGCTIWTTYEVLMWWAYANNVIPYVSWTEHPIYCLVLLLLIPVWRDFYQYWGHRFIHWEPLYRISHYVHHKNVNVGPWSGISMHPIEHLIYFSVVLTFWLVPSNPFHMLFTMLHAGIAPTQAHIGFDEIVIRGDTRLSNDNFFHYLHHRYFTVNYGGDGTVPLDKWFGSFHDGSPEAQSKLRASRRLKPGSSQNEA